MFRFVLMVLRTRARAVLWECMFFLGLMYGCRKRHACPFCDHRGTSEDVNEDADVAPSLLQLYAQMLYISQLVFAQFLIVG